MFSHCIPFVLVPTLLLFGRGGRGESGVFLSFDFLAKLSLSLSPSLESEFDFLNPLNTLSNSIVLLIQNIHSNHWPRPRIASLEQNIHIHFMHAHIHYTH